MYAPFLVFPLSTLRRLPFLFGYVEPFRFRLKLLDSSAEEVDVITVCVAISSVLSSLLFEELVMIIWPLAGSSIKYLWVKIIENKQNNDKKVQTSFYVQTNSSVFMDIYSRAKVVRDNTTTIDVWKFWLLYCFSINN